MDNQNRNILADETARSPAQLESDNRRLRRMIGTLEAQIASLRRGERSDTERYDHLSGLLDRARDMIYRMSLPDGRFEYVSPSSSQVFGCHPEKFYKNPRLVNEMIHPEWREYFECQWDKLLSGQLTNVYEYQIITKDGELKWLNQRNVLVRDGNGNSVAIEGIVTDVTESKRAEESLRRAHERLSIYVANSPIGVVEWDAEFRVKYWSNGAERIFGWNAEEVVGKHWSEWDHIHEDDREMAGESADALSSGRERSIFSLVKNLRKDGSTAYCEWYRSAVYDDAGDVVYILSFAHDITERKMAEMALSERDQQIARIQKMESIGTLAGGISHDFNNLLTVINGHAELALMTLDPEEKACGDIEMIMKSASKASSLTRQLLAFSRRQIIEPRVLHINSLITDLDRMLRRLIGEDITIEINLSCDLPPIKADPGQIEQILINLIVNARDAINTHTDRASDKKISIDTGRVFFDDHHVLTHPGCQRGEHLLISVSDNGTGMDEQTREKIFEPFFTTKRQVRGTGMGLATVYGIVKQNNGSFDVFSEFGRGTTFKVYWPLAARDDLESASLEKKKRPNEVAGGTEHVLLAEDDDHVRRFAALALKNAGYRVCEASHGLQALQILRERGSSFDLLVTDLVMPKMNGKELAEIVNRELPDLPVLFASGYTDNQISRNGHLENGIHFIHKPYTVHDLTRKIRGVLDQT